MSEDFRRFISIKISELTCLWFRTELNADQFDKQQILIGEIIQKYEKDVDFARRRGLPFREPIKEDQSKIQAMAKHIADLTDIIYKLRTDKEQK